MFGRKLNKNVTDELERRKRALDRSVENLPNSFGESFSTRVVESGDPLTSIPEYNFSEMMQKTTYARLASPLYTFKNNSVFEIRGRLLSSSVTGEKLPWYNNNHFKNEYWNTLGDQRGYVPPPGITNIRTAYAGAGATINTIKEADITLRLYSLDQYNTIVPYFVRIGTILYLEYGWSNPRIELDKISAYPREFLTVTQNEDGEDIVDINLKAIQEFPDEFAINTRGNSDLFVGKVTNYEAKMQEDGGFEINLSLKTTGHSMYYAPTNADKRVNVRIAKNVPTETYPETGPNGEEIKENSKGQKYYDVPGGVRLVKPIEDNSASSELQDNMDERSALILLSKAKLIIQKDFNLIDIFSSTIESGIGEAIGEQNSIEGLPQPSHYFATEAGGVFKAFKKVKEGLTNKDFFVTSTKDFNGQDYKYLVAIHRRTADLIITMQYAGTQEVTYHKYDKSGEDQGTDTRSFSVWKINYYPSMKYIEDNILSRLFGTVRDSDGVINAGVRSVNIPKNLNYSSKLPFRSNKMLIHKELVPKKFNDILVNTDAMSAILQRGGTGQYKTETIGGLEWLGFEGKSAKFIDSDLKKYQADIGKILNRLGLPFINEDPTPKDTTTATDEITNPYHVAADIRHMYVNIELVQEAFLGSANIKFCNRNYYPSSADTIVVDGNVIQRNQIFDREGSASSGDYKVHSYHQDNNIKFSKEACVKTVREGLYNMWNSISSNFHNFPNFEVGANVNLPNFLQVYDLRYTKANEFYEFDVYNKDSIIKSIEFNSQVPTTVQLAATFGTSTKYDFDKLIGGSNTGLKEDLMYGLNRNSDIKQKQSEDSLYALSFENSLYLPDQVALNVAKPAIQKIEVLEQEIEEEQEFNDEVRREVSGEMAASIAQMNIDDQRTELEGLQQDVALSRDPVTQNLSFKEEPVPGQGKLFTSAVKEIRLEKGEGSTYPFYGLTPNLVAGTPESVTENLSDEEDRIRSLYPDLNQRFQQMQSTLSKLFQLDTTTGAPIKSDKKLEDKISVDGQDQNVTLDLDTGEIDGVLDSKSTKTLSFTTTYTSIETDIVGQRGYPIIEMGTHSDYQAYLDYLIFEDEQQSLELLNGTISYFELSFTIDGISGILPGEAFTISYLPDLIKDYFYFVVKNVEQTCTAEGWTTTITALQRRKYFIPKASNSTVVALKTYKTPEPKIMKIVKPKPEPKPTGSVEPEEPGIVRFPMKQKPFRPFALPQPPTLPPVETTELAKPPVNFYAYDVPDGPEAEIVLSWSDGNAQVTTTPGADEQQAIIVYPDGDKNNAPVLFTLGVTDILSKREYDAIINKYKESFPIVTEGGKTIEDTLMEQYEEITIKQGDRGQGEINYGQWDEVDEITFYAAKRPIGSGDGSTSSTLSVSKYIENLIEGLNVIGDDTSERANSNAGVSSNFYADDIIARILAQPQRTRLTVLENEKEDIEPMPTSSYVATSSFDYDAEFDYELELDELKFETFDLDEPPPPTRANIVFVENDPDTNQEEEVEVKPKEPILSTYQAYYMDRSYGKEAWNQNHEVLYALCGGWGTKGAGYTKGGVYYGECRPDDPNLQNISVPFKKRMEFWDEMIQKPNEGGKYDREKALQQMKKLKATGEFDKMKPNQTWTPQWSLPAGYNPDISRKAISWYKKKDDNKKLVNVGKTFYNDPNLDE